MTLPRAACIDYFNRNNPLIHLQTRFSISIRKQIWSCFPIHPCMAILEVGATPDMELEDSNYFSRTARQFGCDVWITSPEDCSAVSARYDLKPFSFNEFLSDSPRKFDFVISSAVLEHVGDHRDHKIKHLRDLRKAASQWVVISTPNRLHWMEFHTKIPFIHWLPKKWHRCILRGLGMTHWADPSHLDLLTRDEFQTLISEAFYGLKIKFKEFKFLGMTSNLFALVDMKNL